MNDKLIRGFFHSLASPSGQRLLRSYQSQLLRRQLAYAARHSPFYREKFASLGLDPRSIQSIADLPRLGFFTLPADLQADPHRFLAVPRSQIVYAMSSSGSTGEPKIIFLTRRDWTLVTRTAANAMQMLGVTSADVGQILFCQGGSTSWMTGPVVQSALEHIGVFILPTGNALPISKQIETIQRFGSTLLFGPPSYLHRLTVEGSAYADLRTLGVRIIRLGAEPWSEDLRSYLEQAWCAQALDSFGMMELSSAGAGECFAKQGLHLSPYLLAEVIDPQTGANLPHGELGELVFTTLEREGSPLLRYRSGDLGRLLPDETCPCRELPTPRISRIAGRLDDMLILGTGENIYPEQIESALLQVSGLAAFQVIVEKAGYKDRLRVRAEAGEVDPVRLEQAILASLYHAIPFLEHEIHQSQTVTDPVVELLPAGQLLEESPLKLRRLLDRRNR